MNFSQVTDLAGYKHHSLCSLFQAGGADKVLCFDPATGEKLAEIKAWTPNDVKVACAKARAAQADWSKTSFAERRKVLGSLLRFVVQNQETICKVAARDSGKTSVWNGCVGTGYGQHWEGGDTQWSMV
jgi:acyl-CoA reductase-like NAD-dependent aldehyde dehydrogenase